MLFQKEKVELNLENTQEKQNRQNRLDQTDKVLRRDISFNNSYFKLLLSNLKK